MNTNEYYAKLINVKISLLNFCAVTLNTLELSCCTWYYILAENRPWISTGTPGRAGESAECIIYAYSPALHKFLCIDFFSLMLQHQNAKLSFFLYF